MNLTRHLDQRREICGSALLYVERCILACSGTLQGSFGISSMATLVPKVPSLPPELWHEIIQLVPHRPLDLTSLWLDIRNVNHCFRDLVEDVFMSEHLKSTKIQCRIGKMAMCYFQPSL